jgi:hypothetical protein
MTIMLVDPLLTTEVKVELYSRKFLRFFSTLINPLHSKPCIQLTTYRKLNIKDLLKSPEAGLFNGIIFYLSGPIFN